VGLDYNIKIKEEIGIYEQHIIKKVVFWDVDSATSQKTAFFIVTAVKTSNLTTYYKVAPHNFRG
jgi:hypothetical protein